LAGARVRAVVQFGVVRITEQPPCRFAAAVIVQSSSMAIEAISIATRPRQRFVIEKAVVAIC
jgi:hypothetical protein